MFGDDEWVLRVVSLLNKTGRICGEAVSDKTGLKRRVYVLAVVRRIRLVLDEIEELAE